MKCNTVKKKLILLLDNELSDRQMIKIQHHVDRCPDCSQQFEKLSQLWEFTGDCEPIEPSPYLWPKLSAKITEYEKDRSFWSGFIAIIDRYAVPVTATLIFLIGIVTGIYLGNFPADQNADWSTQPTVLSRNEQLVKYSYWDVFDDLPSESIGGIYIALESAKE